MDNQPFFSIVLPIFNRADRVRLPVNSVLNQSFDDWELIVVDDGSLDSEELKKNLAEYKEPRIIYVKRNNGGGGAARNTGIDEARGKYIAFLDSDDEFLSEKLHAVYLRLESNKNSKVFLYSRMYVDRGGGNRWIKPNRGIGKNERVDEYLMCTPGWMQTSTIVVEASLAKSVRFNENLPSSQDTDFSIRCVNNCDELMFIEEPLSVMHDKYDPSRVSKQKKLYPLLEWIESMRGVNISEKSYWAYRGWQCARIASYKSVLSGLKYFFPSLIRFSYSPVVAARILMQIVFSQKIYQFIATSFIAIFGVPKK